MEGVLMVLWQTCYHVKQINSQVSFQNTKTMSYFVTKISRSVTGLELTMDENRKEKNTKPRYLFKGKEGVLSVFPNSIQKLQTTRSWDFVGMPLKRTERNTKAESNLIIGVLDTGIWPQSPSFNDKGFGPPPRKWKDQKLSPVDEDGHGTHTASTAAGVPVKGAGLYGIGKGTARGGVPSARIAAYKVCWASGCSDMDLLAGFDSAIADGVDVISVSVGGSPRKFFQDSIAIGAFHAMKKGIFTACSAGNEGPDLLTVQNVAPWITTVAASRKIVYCLGKNQQDHILYNQGVAGIIVSRESDNDTPSPFLIPGTTVSPEEGKNIDAYINSTKFTVQPDIAAPGLGILAAYSKLTSMTGHPDYDKRFVDYQIASGTSMACPHVSAAAAYINTAAMELASGSGLINPTKAVNPGLIYDINTSAYIAYLCKVGYNSTTLGILNGGRHQYDCKNFKPTRGVDGLNYPSMQLQVEQNVTNFSAVFKRIVKNVGDERAIYEAKVVKPLGLTITVTPPVLKFEKLNQKLAFTVVLEGAFVKKDAFLLSGSIEWRDSKHSVVSPVSVYRYIPPVLQDEIRV
ncbi:Peptidase S8/S53 domain-containing protein [Cynara cardunculus var. scolymus]|uniref:Peptidase S8/S53 domain-containing protein n=1 Tax=Cynara cardunculus var. scolymus TaxID=59895 RepID=A0A124SB63_CYNCS|nr:Peptidase S8/S53 domain-containing protein [Cynara cardunculus var. scolymus]